MMYKTFEVNCRKHPKTMKFSLYRQQQTARNKDSVGRTVRFRRGPGAMCQYGLLIFFISVAYASSSVFQDDPVWNIRHVLPELNLENNSVTDVHFNVGEPAFLPCRFPQYSRHHEGSVSWIRRWDWQILSAGVYSNTNDNRFVVLHLEGSDDWTLQIKHARLSDNGTYECQVHTGSGFLSQFINLHVVQPRAVIVGARELHVSSGDTFTLTCIIEKMISPPVYVMWQQRNVPLNYAPDRPRLTVVTNPKGIHTSSTLKVVRARYEDSGNYTCTAPNAESASVMVYVTEGDAVAAIQRIERITKSSSSVFVIFSFHSFILLFFIHSLVFSSFLFLT